MRKSKARRIYDNRIRALKLVGVLLVAISLPVAILTPRSDWRMTLLYFILALVGMVTFGYGVFLEHWEKYNENEDQAALMTGFDIIFPLILVLILGLSRLL